MFKQSSVKAGPGRLITLAEIDEAAKRLKQAVFFDKSTGGGVRLDKTLSDQGRGSAETARAKNPFNETVKNPYLKKKPNTQPVKQANDKPLGGNYKCPHCGCTWHTKTCGHCGRMNDKVARLMRKQAEGLSAAPSMQPAMQASNQLNTPPAQNINRGWGGTSYGMPTTKTPAPIVGTSKPAPTMPGAVKGPGSAMVAGQQENLSTLSDPSYFTQRFAQPGAAKPAGGLGGAKPAPTMGSTSLAKAGSHKDLGQLAKLAAVNFYSKQADALSDWNAQWAARGGDPNFRSLGYPTQGPQPAQPAAPMQQPAQPQAQPQQAQGNFNPGFSPNVQGPPTEGTGSAQPQQQIPRRYPQQRGIRGQMPQQQQPQQPAVTPEQQKLYNEHGGRGNIQGWLKSWNRTGQAAEQAAQARKTQGYQSPWQRAGMNTPRTAIAQSEGPQPKPRAPVGITGNVAPRPGAARTAGQNDPDSMMESMQAGEAKPDDALGEGSQNRYIDQAERWIAGGKKGPEPTDQGMHYGTSGSMNLHPVGNELGRTGPTAANVGAGAGAAKPAPVAMSQGKPAGTAAAGGAKGGGMSIPSGPAPSTGAGEAKKPMSA